jgi:Zn-dependent protease with chaperone function
MSCHRPPPIASPQAAGPPGRGTWRLALWLALGYGVLAGPLLLGLALAGAGLGLAVALPGWTAAAVATGMIAAGLVPLLLLGSCLRMRFVAPQGLELLPAEHPGLFRVLHDLGEEAGGVTIHRVVLDPELNASLVRQPRLGVFGCQRNHLVLGLLLMEALPPDEFRAVLAHELGHLARAEAKIGAWARRTRGLWERLASPRSTVSRCPWIARFLRWYQPRLNARAARFARAGELEADAFAARAVSPAVLASGLCRLAVAGRRLEEELWHDIDREIDGQDDLPDDVMDRASALLASEAEPEEAVRRLERVMAATPVDGDDHPALSERLAALDRQAGVSPATGGKSAADEWLSPTLRETARERFNREWSEAARMVRTRRALRQEIERNSRSRKAWERIAALVRLDGLEKVQPEVIALLERHPSHSGALFLRGSHLAEKGDPEACGFLERATEDPTIASRAFETLARLHALEGRGEEASRATARRQQHEAELRAALVERSRIGPGDRFFPQDLAEGEAEALRQLLEQEPAVRRAWVAAKEVRRFPRWPNVVVVLEFRHAQSPAARRILENRLTQLWCGEAYITVLARDEMSGPALRVICREIPDSLVFRRK